MLIKPVTASPIGSLRAAIESHDRVAREFMRRARHHLLAGTRLQAEVRRLEDEEREPAPAQESRQ